MEDLAARQDDRTGTSKDVAGDPKKAEAENEAVEEATHLSARLVYQVILREGEEELARPRSSLVYSGLAAGVCISFSIIGEAMISAEMPDNGVATLIENFGYSLGFLLVILGRLQLFTENTITTVMPLLTRKSWKCARATARLWGIVLAANVVGCLIAAAFIVFTPVFDSDVRAAIHELSVHATSPGPVVGFFKAIPAGLLVAALVWMLSAGQRSESFWIILIFTWVIATGDFTHIIAGSVEMFYLVLVGELGPGGALFGFFIPVLLGNIVGGTAVFTTMAWGQVREEIAHT